MSRETESVTVLKMTTGVKMLVWAVCGGAGIALGFVLPWLLQHVANWPIPYIDLLKFLGSFDQPVMVFGRPAVLGIIGLVIAFVITYQSAELMISDMEIRIREGDDERTVDRLLVGGVYRHGGKVRIESVGGRVLFDDDVEGGHAAIAEAFLRHGYPWENVVPERQAVES